MCGIAALLNLQKESKISTIEVENMLERISHRGPDAKGVLQKGDIILGLNRLSILDPSEKGAQPMTKHGLSIAYNGLVYNYLELRDELENEGIKFNSGTDTEVILSAYHHWGPDCTKRFNGMWAFLIFNNQKNQLFASRDRYGIKPLYCYKNDQKIYFASEIKAFTSTSNWNPHLNHNRAYDFLKFGLKNHTTETLFQNVTILEPATNYTIDCSSGKFSKNTYYKLSYDDSDNPPGFEESQKHFYKLFHDSLKLRLRSDVKIGITLSGGLDSSAIALGIKNIEDSSIKESICSTSNYLAYDESEYAISVAKKCAYNLHQVPFEKSHLKLLEKTIYVQDEPFPGASVIAQNTIYEKAKSLGLKVMFSGQGADEYLMGYNAFLSLYFLNRNPLLHPLSFLNFLWKHKKTVWNHNILRKRASEPGINLKIDQNKIYQPESICELKERGHQYFTKTVLPSLLHFEDHNSMAYGVESRLPFLDYRLVDFCFSLPEEYFIKKGVRKRLLRESFKSEYPQKIYKRYDKSAFSNPLDKWIRKDPGYFNNLLAETGQEVNNTGDLELYWRMIGFAIWKKTFNISD